MKTSKDALMTRDLFYEWFSTHFVPQVKRIAAREKTEAKALLLLNNAPVHHQTLFHPDCPLIRVLVMPPNTSIVLQPLNKDVVKSFKLSYAEYFINLAKNEPRKDGKKWPRNVMPITDRLQKRMNLRHAIYLISEAWSHVPRSTLHKGWSKLWPGMTPINWNDEPSSKKELFNLSDIPVELQPIVSDVEPQSVIDYYTLGSKDLDFIAGQLKNTNFVYGDFENPKVPENPDHLDYCSRKYKSPTVVHITPMIEQNDESEASSSSLNQVVDSKNVPVEGKTKKLQTEIHRVFVNTDHIDYTGNYKVPVVTTMELDDIDEELSSSSSLDQLIDLKSVLRDEDSDDDEACPRRRKLLKIANYIMKELKKPCKPGSNCCDGKKCSL